MKSRGILVVALIVLVASLASAQKMPDWELDPAYGSVELEAGFLPDSHRIELVAGGPVDLGGLGYYGYVAEAPDYDLYYESEGGALYIYVEDAEADTVLLVNAPDGEWYYNDDWQGSNPGLAFNDADAGLYDIWVGTYGEGNVSATLAISEIGFDVAGGTGPDWSLEPTYGTVTLDAGFSDDPNVTTITAGGSIDLASIGFYGYVADAPDLDLYYEAGGFTLFIYVADQDEDTVLLVNDPSGNWHFSDDEIGFQPGIRFDDPESGLYDIWIGTFESSMTSADLAISEIGW